MVSEPDKQAGSSWRLKLGGLLFGLSIFIPIVGVLGTSQLDLGTGATASVSGGMLLAGELLGIAGVAIMGKPGYAAIKSKVGSFFKQYGPPQQVSRLRYRVGLVLFLIPLLFGWVAPYRASWFPGYAESPIVYAAVGDILLLVSLFVLGGEFWDKLRSLFIHNEQVYTGERPVPSDP